MSSFRSPCSCCCRVYPSCCSCGCLRIRKMRHTNRKYIGKTRPWSSIPELCEQWNLGNFSTCRREFVFLTEDSWSYRIQWVVGWSVGSYSWCPSCQTPTAAFWSRHIACQRKLLTQHEHAVEIWQELIRIWDGERELFYDDIAHAFQNTKKTYFV